MNANARRLQLFALSLLRLLPLRLLRLLPTGKLVNTDRVRSSVKRMFKNNVSEVLGELFQNSMRAGARAVHITTREGGFTVSDDGCGVEGVKGFLALLKIAETKFKGPRIEDMAPMGVGLNALYSHGLVRTVTFVSGNLELTIDTRKWFEDESYYRTWFDRMRTRARSVGGLSISVECDPKMVALLKEALKPKDSRGEYSPAQGYTGILLITLDGEAVETRLPKWAQITRVVVETTFKGSRLLIGFRGDASFCERSSSVLWFGQLIGVKFPGPFDFHLEVNSGRPVNPRSPSREGLVEDGAYHALLAFVKDTLFGFVFNPANRPRVSASLVAYCYELDKERARRESPYYVVKELKLLADPDSKDEMDVCGELGLFAYADDAQPLLLHSGVTLVVDGEEEDDESGRCTFLGMTGTAYELAYGDESRLQIRRLWWKPGARLKEFFREPGEWGLGTLESAPEEWLPVTDDNVFTYTDTASWDIEESDIIAAASDPIEFLYNYTWAVWSYDHDEASWHELHNSFEGSIGAYIRRIIGNCVPYTFCVGDLPQFFDDQGARIESININYPEETNLAKSITVINSTGQTVELQLMR